MAAACRRTPGLLPGRRPQRYPSAAKVAPRGHTGPLPTSTAPAARRTPWTRRLVASFNLKFKNDVAPATVTSGCSKLRHTPTSVAFGVQLTRWK
jgi:hypothetical protein